MSTRRTKRKVEDASSPQDKRTRTENLIYQVKTVKVGRGDFVYFGRERDSQIEERLTPQWLNKNSMSKSWRRHKLRGKHNQILGTWVTVPVGSKTKPVPSTNPCVPGK